MRKKPRAGSYQVAVSRNKKIIHMGTFKSPIKAALVADICNIEIYGVFAILNYPEKRIWLTKISNEARAVQKALQRNASKQKQPNIRKAIESLDTSQMTFEDLRSLFPGVPKPTIYGALHFHKKDFVTDRRRWSIRVNSLEGAEHGETNQE